MEQDNTFHCYFHIFLIVRQLQRLVGTNQGGQTYVVSFERYIHKHYRKSWWQSQSSSLRVVTAIFQDGSHFAKVKN